MVPIQDILVKSLTNPPLAYGLQPWPSKDTGFCPPPRFKSAYLTKELVVFMASLGWKTTVLTNRDLGEEGQQ